MDPKPHAAVGRTAPRAEAGRLQRRLRFQALEPGKSRAGHELGAGKGLGSEKNGLGFG